VCRSGFSGCKVGEVVRQRSSGKSTRTTRTHHDALEFPDGQIVLLTDLFEDQRQCSSFRHNPLLQRKRQERVALVS
jgi:hypothetical protein